MPRPWGPTCHHSRLLYAGETIASTCGVQQGDPLGPLLFSLALQPALVAARGHCDVCFAYLDDLVMTAYASQLAQGLQALQHVTCNIGLQLELSKCELAMLQLFPTGIGVNTTGNFSFLGAAIGDEAYCNRHTFSTRVEPAKPCLQALADLPDAQTAMLLLRHCQSHVKLTRATAMAQRFKPLMSRRKPASNKLGGCP